jgi:hypothetical protein
LFFNVNYLKFKIYLTRWIIINNKIIFIYYIILFTKKLWFYKILSPLYRKYILKIIKK